jgi:hypothetical protein
MSKLVETLMPLEAASHGSMNCPCRNRRDLASQKEVYEAKSEIDVDRMGGASSGERFDV